MIDLRGKIVFITGSSAGIGKACAERYAKSGARLILMARRIDKIKEVAEDLFKKYGTESYNIQADVRNYKELKKYINDLPENWQDIDVLINNAGKARGLDFIHEGDLDDWEEMIDTNVKGLLYLTRLVMPGMVERKSGHIINIGSIAGRQVYPKGGVYCASKAAVKSISESIAIDANGTGVRVSNIDPGLVETEFASVRFHGDEEKAETVYQGYKPLEGVDIAEICYFCSIMPEHVMIQDVLVTPTAQATATIVHKVL
jgi:3-hydroxy acid dehydrogenase / malonic semialdehyde reductase